MTTRFSLLQGDITTLEVDAIVNAANHSLQGGGGVDGAIHRKAGPELREYNREHLGTCPTGEAKVSPGFNLPAGHVIHTVGPIWHGGGKNEASELAACYKNSLAKAVLHGFQSIAFPCISTGIYGFPKESACQIALDSCLESIGEGTPEDIVFVCFDSESHGLYQNLMTQKGLI